MSDTVVVERTGRVAAAFLNRPQRLNALDLETLVALKTVLQGFAHNDDLDAVVIGGRGKAFCAGGDLAWVAGFPGGMRAALSILAGEFHQVIIELREMKKPVIAAIEGVAAGGGLSVALACDFRVMHREATLRHAYGSAGLSMDGGASFMLPRLVGFARALEIAAFDEPITAERAASIGLATQIAESGAVEAAMAMAERLTNRALGSFAWSKQLLNVSYSSPLEVQLTRERQGIVECSDRPEGREGVLAFVERRSPNFRGARIQGDES